jgi:hypothetical protein
VSIDATSDEWCSALAWRYVASNCSTWNIDSRGIAVARMSRLALNRLDQ